MVNRSESKGASSGTNPIPPPPPPPPPPLSGTKRPLTPKSKEKSSICPICNKNMYHEKALNGHIRWHTAEEREAAGIGAVRSLVASVEEQEPKRVKVPDLNQLPPPEDGEE